MLNATSLIRAMLGQAYTEAEEHLEALAKRVAIQRRRCPRYEA